MSGTIKWILSFFLMLIVVDVVDDKRAEKTESDIRRAVSAAIDSLQTVESDSSEINNEE